MKYQIDAAPPGERLHSAGVSFIIVLFAAVILILPEMARSEKASTGEMDQVCRNWLAYTIYQSGGWAGSINPDIIEVRDITENDTLLARYYEISSGGYIIVPALKDLPPVKAYSEESRLEIDDPDGFALLIRQVLLERFRAYIETYGSLETKPPAGEKPLFAAVNRARWDDFAMSPKDFSIAANKSLAAPTEGTGPLLTTSWHQGYPYNLYCPMGDGGRCVAGCVATALAQIMWYHQWPPAGDGSYSYYWGGDQSCGGSTPGQTLAADFSDPYFYTSTSENLAEINYEVGVAINMDYGYCGSSAYFSPILTALAFNFKYDPSLQILDRSSYSSEDWFGIIQDQINQNHPTLYGIYSHAIVCDGWRIQADLKQYHMNYGWNDSHNTWYVVDQLYCPWEGCGLASESMIINIIPESGDPWLGESVLSDAAYGDGDGIAEAGETIELTFTIANYGGAEITDVELNLSLDDAALVILDGNVYLGAIPGRDSVDNAGDPMVFEIPADYTSRIDSFILEITWNGTDIDTLYTEKAVGRPAVVLVDDDDNGGVEAYYEEALRNIRIPYDVWIHSEYASPDSAFLDQYNLVVWFSGDYQASPLNSSEIEAMRGYMNAGGNLFLTGQGYAAQLDGYDPVFLSDYLRVNYQSTQTIPVLSTEATGLVFEAGHMIAIQGGDGASNQTHPDLIVSVNGGSGELKYLGTEYLGAVSYAGDYNSLFFSFGFEAVVSNDSRWRNRDSVISDVLGFFGFQRPNRCPWLENLTVSPGLPTNLTDHSPDFSWTYYDIEPSAQTMYQIQVGLDNDWQTAEMWDDGPVTSPDNLVTYAGLDLVDGEEYHVRVRVYDGALWSDWAETQIRMNSVPSSPIDLTPANMSGTASATPTLSHANAVDAEADDIVHDYELYDDEAMTILLTQAYDQLAGSDSSSWNVDITLSDEAEYFWRVRGKDPYEDGHWSDPASFWVNSENQLPATFDLLLPENGSSLSTPQATFVWKASNDADLHDEIRYTLYYSTDSTFATSISLDDLEDTTVIGDIAYGQKYYWKVRAFDLFEGEIFSDQIFMFTTASIGDANGDGNVDVGDAVYIINYVFKGGPPPQSVEAADANCDGGVNIGDAVYLIGYIFKGGPPPGC